MLNCGETGAPPCEAHPMASMSSACEEQSSVEDCRSVLPPVLNLDSPPSSRHVAEEAQHKADVTSVRVGDGSIEANREDGGATIESNPTAEEMHRSEAEAEAMDGESKVNIH